MYEPVSVNAEPKPTDDYVTVTQSQPVTIAVLANDSDPDGNALTLGSVSFPANGTAVISSDRIIDTSSLAEENNRMETTMRATTALPYRQRWRTEATVYVTVEALPMSRRSPRTIT